MSIGNGHDRAVALAAEGDVRPDPQELERLLRRLQQSGPGLERLLDHLDDLAASGTLDVLAELAQLVKALLDSMTPTLMARVARTAVGVALQAENAMEDGREVFPALGDALNASMEAVRSDREVPGLLGLLSALRSPESRRALAFLVTFSRELGGRLQPSSR
ncbi:DUF1641 domain-containing protein [Limnochorda pilosa]|uniref:DUF1641 domain-containing protein n=1 Tax=Limnochorda pilosa TaxID=1555112 RepID=A0A0K2SJC9_LIMPI|nr:DUF1641 domain-containing protein [Limnochorda pilosa]BAS27185.1 hypothetical protein LIP_1334 [Limnochorda pilosa]